MKKFSKNRTEEPKVVRTRWMNNPTSTILVTIPCEFRKKYDLDKPKRVLMAPLQQGILIRNLKWRLLNEGRIDFR
jgi:hypothetical protein